MAQQPTDHIHSLRATDLNICFYTVDKQMFYVLQCKIKHSIAYKYIYNICFHSFQFACSLEDKFPINQLIKEIFDRLS